MVDMSSYNSPTKKINLANELYDLCILTSYYRFKSKILPVETATFLRAKLMKVSINSNIKTTRKSSTPSPLPFVS